MKRKVETMRGSKTSRSKAFFAGSLLVCLFAANRPGETFKGWGESVDPDGDCKFSLEKSLLTIKVPGTIHDLSVEAKTVSAPRVLRDISGDWIARVEIPGKIAHRGESTSPIYWAFHGAGILVWKDDQTYVRLERAGVIRPDGTYNHYVNLEVRLDGQRAGGGGISVPDKPTFLRMVRRGGKLIPSYGSDGKLWTQLEPLEIDLPLDLKVGVAAVNTSTEPLEAQFQKFAVVRVRAAENAKP